MTRRSCSTASPARASFANIVQNPKVSLTLDVTDLGRDVIRIEGTAEQVDELPAADEVPQYLAKYAERIGALFGTSEQFAEQYSVPLIVTPTKLHA
jgi:PPOX class probable F420-dependent enzyme